MRELHYPSVTPTPADAHWFHPLTPPLLATEERSPADVERAVETILGDLKGKRIGKVTAERIRDSAADRVKQIESNQSFHRAISKP